MKKMIVMLVTASALIAGMASCKKGQMPKEAIKQTVNVDLKTNEAYTLVLPKNLRDDPYEITTQAGHFSISQVGVNASGERIFQYTPATGFIGTDQVVVSNDQEREEHEMHPQGPPPPKHMNGGCNKTKGEEDHYIITINFVVERTENTNSDISQN